MIIRIGQAETHTAEPLVPEPSVFEVELAIEKLKNHKSPGIDQIPAELIKAGGSTIRREIYKLIISILNNERMPEGEPSGPLSPKKGSKGFKILTKGRHVGILPRTFD